MYTKAKHCSFERVITQSLPKKISELKNQNMNHDYPEWVLPDYSQAV
jgi:hypothetical protein